MADPSLSLTYQDYQIRVAEYLGNAYTGAAGTSAAAVPVNTYDADLVQRLVNQGYMRFLQANPRWNFLNVPTSVTLSALALTGICTAGTSNTFTDTSLIGNTSISAGWGLTITHADSSLDEQYVSSFNSGTGQVTITGTFVETPQVGDSYSLMASPPNVFGQPWRYFMPSDFYGDVLTPFTYNIGGPRLTVNTVDEVTIRELRAGANTAGTVSNCAFRPVPATNSSVPASRWEVLFWPAPSNANTLTCVYKRWPSAFSSNTDRSVAGFQHDLTILAACIAEAERMMNDKAGEREQFFQAILKQSMDLDARASHKHVSPYGDRSEERVGMGGRPLNYYSASTYNNVRIP
jgi:hypothetical protein